MKKTITGILALLTLLGALSGCGSAPSAGQAEAEREPVGEQAAPEAAPEALSADGSVLFERDGVKVTTAGLDVDPTTDEEPPIIWLDIENSGEETAYLGVSGGSVNGYMTDVYLIDFHAEDEEYFGADYTFMLAVPVGGGRYALGYSAAELPGVGLDTLGEMELCFTMAEDEFTWPDYTSEPVTVAVGEVGEAADLASLGTVVLDDDVMTLVLGAQEYDDWFGPEIPVYVENKTDHYIGVAAETAEADGNVCDYIYYYAALAPGKRSAGLMSFEEPIRGMKGFENLTVGFSLAEADTLDELSALEGAALAPASVQYPPQVWGVYENDGLTLEVQPRYNDLITVETPTDDADGVLLSVSEIASVEAGGFDGAGWLFAIGRVGEERLHELLCSDMSGMEVFAQDDEGRYYIFYHPTDVRYARATDEEMERDMDQWVMLNEWAANVSDGFAEKNGLSGAAYGNSEVDIYLARAAWMDDAAYTLSTTEYGPVEANGVDGAPYAEFVMQGWFSEAEPDETPDGEYVVLSFPDEDVRLDFFFAPGAYVRVVRDDYEALYQAAWYDEDLSYAEVMQRWYYAAAEKAGLREPDGTPEDLGIPGT